MEPALGIILSVLSATATAIWSVWTWSEQQNEERRQKRDQMAALYVNPFLASAGELQRRLYGILNEQELEFYQQEYSEKSEVGSEEAIELLYVMVKYFGWSWYVYRYSPYSQDKQATELSAKIRATFANYKDFAREAFYFSFSEQNSLGQKFVKVFGRADSFNPEFESVPIYEFAEEINNDIKKERPLYQNVRKTIQSIDQANHIDELEGRERLIAIHNQLLALLNYLEDKEGFSVSSSIRKKVQFRGSAFKEAEIVHSMAGRVRLRIPRLRQERSYAERLRQRLESLADVQTVRINLDASSVAISYTPTISEAAFKQRIFEAVGLL